MNRNLVVLWSSCYQKLVFSFFFFMVPPLQLERAGFILKSALFFVCVAQFVVPFVLIVAFIFFPVSFTPPCLTPPLMLSTHIQSSSN